MQIISILGGLVMLALGVLLLVKGLPVNGVPRPAVVGRWSDMYAFAILLCFTMGASFVLSGILR
ncbi:MAG TPA: hypothetical protein VIL09_01830 [Microvirga sp.]|jgi:hypothetical protein